MKKINLADPACAVAPRPVKLIAVDLDGTLLNDFGRASEKDIAAIRSAMDQGVLVVASTGRPYDDMPVSELERVGIRYAITVNGAAVYTIPGRECLFERTMDSSRIADLLEPLSELDVFANVMIDGHGNGVSRQEPVIGRLGTTEYFKEKFRRDTDFFEDLSGRIREKHLRVQKIAITFYKEEDGTIHDLDRVCEIMRDYPELTMVAGWTCNREITGEGVSKGAALLWLCDRFGVPLDQTMAIGDTENDAEIIRTAGIGVAMANSDDEALKAADYLTSSNLEDGVGLAIRSFLP